MQASLPSPPHDGGLTQSEKVALDYLVGRGLKVRKNNRSPDFVGDGAFEVKKVYLDRHGNRHVVLNSSQFMQVRDAYPDAKYLFVDDRRVEAIPFSGIDPMNGVTSIKAGNSEFTIHWNPKMVTEVPGVLRMDLDQDEVERIKTIRTKTGLKQTTEIVRQAIMHEYLNVTGSPVPNGKKK